MDTEPVKRGRGRPRKNPPPTVVAKSTIVRISSIDGSRTEYNNIVHSSLNYAGNKFPGPGSVDPDAFRLKDLDSAGRTPVIVNADEVVKNTPPAVTEVKRKRGRPRKNPLPDADPAGSVGNAAAQPAAGADGVPIKKRRGRPPKNPAQFYAAKEEKAEAAGAVAEAVIAAAADPVSAPANAPVADAPVADAPVKRRPGRPRKNPLPGDSAIVPGESVSQTDAVVQKRKYTRRTPQSDLPENASTSEGENPFDFKGPGVRHGKEIRVGDSRLSFFYIVFKNPENDGLLFPDTMHSIQHMLSAAAKETHLNNIVKVLPCGSRTAFEVAVLDPQSDFARNALRKLMITAAYMEKLPDSELQRCSNPRYHNFEDAHREICDFVNTMYGVIINSQTGDYSW
ncbi:MAG: S-ribosylhomocysteine lyase [Clostridia bacterium]|nr:S-ribosylhomocysteine lyase [Clostridia bacterium]